MLRRKRFFVDRHQPIWQQLLKGNINYAAAAAEDPRGIDLYPAASAAGDSLIARLPPSGSIPSCGPRPCVSPPRVESLSYVGGDRQRQDVADELEVLRVVHTFTLPRARRWSRA